MSDIIRGKPHGKNPAPEFQRDAQPGSHSKPLISIIIPTKDSGKTLNKCLESVAVQTYPGYELIVVDGFSSDNSAEISKRFTNNVLLCRGSLTESRNLGVSTSKGELILFIDSDMALEKGLLEEIAGRRNGFGTLIIPEVGCGSGFLARCKSFEKACYLGDAAIETARVFRREAFDTVGGYDSSLHLAEDYDLHTRSSKQFSTGRTAARLYHDTGNLSLLTDLKKSFRYGKSLPRYLGKKDAAKGAWLAARINIIGRCISRFTKDPPAAAGLIALRSLEYIAGAIGFSFGLPYLFLRSGK